MENIWDVCGEPILSKDHSILLTCFVNEYLKKCVFGLHPISVNVIKVTSNISHFSTKINKNMDILGMKLLIAWFIARFLKNGSWRSQKRKNCLAVGCLGNSGQKLYLIINNLSIIYRSTNISIIYRSTNISITCMGKAMKTSIFIYFLQLLHFKRIFRLYWLQIT